MALAAGSRLGSYQILSPLGAGGMGEVYRARDERVDRLVALKVLPEVFLEGKEGGEHRERFEREAKLLASLNHPNVAVLYSFEEIPGSLSPPTPARHILTMELLEGETLRERLNAPLLARKAVEYAVQVAHGLAAAHEKGIVHRDLKPENIFVTQEGRIKILDFGIAKLAPSAARGPLTQAPTEAPATEPGVVVGTVSYMSPEQVTGRPVDARSDLFSLGVILYEMLSGRRPFQMGTAPETMAAILKEEPPDLSEPGRNVPPGLNRIVLHCLEKEPSARFHSAGDVAFALETLSQGTTGGAAAAVRRRSRAAAAVGLALAAVALVGLGLLLGSRRKPPEFAIRRLTFQRGHVTTARFLPDGQTVVFSATFGDEPGEIHTARLDGPESRPLGHRNSDLLAVSRTSELALGLEAPTRPFIYTLGAGFGTLALVPFSGGTPRPRAERVLCADFSPDGRDLATVTPFGNSRSSISEMKLEYPSGTVLHQVAGRWVDSVRVAPDGLRVAFVEHVSGDTGGSVLVAAQGEEARILARGFKDLGGLAWAPSGKEVWFSAARIGASRELFAAGLDGRVRRVFAGLGSLMLQDIARDGRILVSTYDARSRLFFGGAGQPADRELSWFDFSAWPTGRNLTNDGKVVLFGESGEASGADYVLFTRGTDGSPPVRIATFGPGEAFAFSSDERFAVVTRLRPPAIELIPIGAGDRRTIPLTSFDEKSFRAAGLMSDGRTIWFYGRMPGGAGRYWVTDGAGAAPHAATPEMEAQAAPYLTPDERHFVGRVAGGLIALFPRDGGEPRVFPGTAETSLAGSTFDGRFLYTREQRSYRFPMAVRRLEVSTGRSELFREISPPDRVATLPVDVQLTPDGRHHAYYMMQTLGDLYVIEGLK